MNLFIIKKITNMLCLLMFFNLQNNVDLNPSKIGPRQHPSSFLNKATAAKSLLRDNQPHISSSEKILEPSFNDMRQVCFQSVIASWGLLMSLG